MENQENRGMEEIVPDYWAEKEKEIAHEYVDVLREYTEKLNKLDKETNYYPFIELSEDGIPGRFGPDMFSRGWHLMPRKWSELPQSRLEAKLKEYSELIRKYSNRIVQLQEIIAKQNENRR